MGSTFFLPMVILGLVAIAQAQDCSKPVLGANMDLKGEDILLTSFPNGTKVYLACNVGYTLAGGSSTITCTAGSWSPVRMKCERKDCGSAGELDFGTIDYSEGTEFGDQISIRCITGYKLVGSRTITCGDKGWMDRLPSCEVVTCDPPAPITYGTFSPEQEFYEYLKVVKYNCQSDYTLLGPLSSVCSEDGKFKPDAPTCVKVQCEDLQIKHGYQDAGSRPPHKYLATMTFRCNPGYVISGKDTVTCGRDSNWSPERPECKLSTIIKVTTAATTTTTTTTTTTPSGKHPDPPKPTNRAVIGNNYWWLLLIPVILAIGYGVWKYMQKKRGPQRPSSDNEAAKNEEGVPLS